MSARIRLAAVVAIAGLMVPAQVLLARAAQSAEPSLHIATTSLAIGQTVSIDGAGWPGNTALRAELCGANAVDGDVDCAQNASVVFSPGPDGAVQGLLQVFAPPKPCPCLVRVTTVDWSKTVDFPVQVAGVGTAPVFSQAPVVAQPALKVVSVSVSAEHSLGAFFGFSAPRTLNVVLQNVGAANVEDPVLTATFGKKATHGQTIDTRGFRSTTIAPGARISVRVPFRLGAFSIGSYAVSGAASSPPAHADFQTHTSQWPWGLFALCVIGLQLILLAIRDRARRRLAPADEQPQQQERARREPVVRKAPVPEPALASVAAVAAQADKETADEHRADTPELQWRRISESAAVAAALRKFGEIAEWLKNDGPTANGQGEARSQMASAGPATTDALAKSGLAPIDEVPTFDTLAFWALDYRIRGIAKPSNAVVKPKQPATKPKARTAKAGQPSTRTRQPAAKPRQPAAEARRQHERAAAAAVRKVS